MMPAGHDPAPVASSRDDEVIPVHESIVLAVVVAIQVTLRVLYLFHHQVDSDEPQHLHVAWAWTKGLVPYRDVFDNHTPLFHHLAAPFVALAGERADIVLLARFAMLPFFAAALALVASIGRAVFGPRVGAR